jgi:hypothetical protein
MLTCAADEHCSLLPADCDLRLCPVLKPLGEVFQVLTDTTLLDMEALWVAPQGNITGVTTLPGLCQRIREEHLDSVALIGAVAAPIRVEIAALFERIELRVGQRDRKAVHAALGTLSMRPDPLGGGGTCFCRVHETRFSVKPVTPRLLCRLRRCRGARVIKTRPEVLVVVVPGLPLHGGGPSTLRTTSTSSRKITLASSQIIDATRILPPSPRLSANVVLSVVSNFSRTFSTKNP